MNKVIKYIILLLAVIFLCSCSIKNDNNLTIKSDGTLEYDVVIAFDKELLNNMISIDNIDDETSITTSEMKDYFKKNIKDSYLDGLNKEEYSDSNYIGNKYLYRVDDIEKISSDKTDKVIINDYDSEDKLVTKNLFKKIEDVYTANFVYNADDNDYESVNIVNTFIVKLPTKGFKHNADEVKDHGKTLVWHVDNIKNKEIVFSFKLKSKKYIISIISIFFDIAIAVMYLLIVKKKVII